MFEFLGILAGLYAAVGFVVWNNCDNDLDCSSNRAVANAIFWPAYLWKQLGK